MTPYAPPVGEMRFVLDEVAGLDAIASLPGYELATSDTVAAVLDEAANLASDVLAPLNASGDREGSRLENGVVRTPAGFRDAYQRLLRRRLGRPAVSRGVRRTGPAAGGVSRGLRDVEPPPISVSRCARC